MAGERDESLDEAGVEDTPDTEHENESDQGDEQPSMADAVREALSTDEEGDDTPDEAVEAGDEATGEVADTDTSAAAATTEDEAGPEHPENQEPESQNLEELYDSRSLKGKTKERFEKLTSYSKERDKEFEEASNQLKEYEKTVQGYTDMIRDTGASNEQYAQTMQLLKLINTNPKEAISAMQTTIGELSRMHSIKVDGVDVDLLADYPDLKQKVDEGYLDEDSALELVNSRKTLQQNQQVQTESQKRDQHNEFVQTQKEAILDKLKAWNKTDVDFAKKAPELQAAAEFASANLPPEKWPQYMENEYNKITRMARELGQTARRGRREPQPLRSSNSTQSEGQPKTMVEAINSALGG